MKFSFNCSYLSISGKKCFQCPVCPIKSSRRDNIQRHIRNLHTDGNIRELFSQIISSGKFITGNETGNDAIDNGKETTDYSKPITSDADTNEKSVSEPVQDAINTCSVIKYAGRCTETIVNQSIKGIEKPLVKLISSEIVKEPDRRIDTPLTIDLAEPLPTSPQKSVNIYRQLLSPYLRPPKEVIENCNAKKQIHSSFADEIPIIPKCIENRHNQPIRKRYDNLEIYRQILMPTRDDADGKTAAKPAESICEKIVPRQDTEPNRNQNNFIEMHWRKRTSQCFSQMNM